MALYVIADLHLSFGVNKPMDIFPGWENYEEKLYENWVSTVKEEDTVVIAGDISWAMDLNEAKADFEFIHKLPGKKIILKGNHEYWWSTVTKIEKFFKENGFDDIKLLHNNAYAVDGFAVCGSRGWLYNSETNEDVKVLQRELGRVERSIIEAEKFELPIVCFLHYPPVYDGTACIEMIKLLKKHNVKECYFGHIHGTHAIKKAVMKEYGGVNLHLISGDYVKFMPVLIEKI